MSSRVATVSRKTRETEIGLTLALDGSGQSDIRVGIGFFEHMLAALARFAMIDLTITCQGDLEVDAHHTVEDVGICLGQALAQAVGDKRGIRRMGQAAVPMDEALGSAILDISGRPYLVFDAEFATPMLGSMSTQLIEEFFRALCVHAGWTLHLSVPYGRNDHHKAEALYKAVGRALEQAVAIDARIDGVLSTKGSL